MKSLKAKLFDSQGSYTQETLFSTTHGKKMTQDTHSKLEYFQALIIFLILSWHLHLTD